MKANSYTSYLSYKTLRYLHSGMRLSFGKNSMLCGQYNTNYKHVFCNCFKVD